MIVDWQPRRPRRLRRFWRACGEAISLVLFFGLALVACIVWMLP
jgi:hypothetical protein